MARHKQEVLRMAHHPFRIFVSKSLKDFQNHLKSLGMKEDTIKQRMRGATEFAKYLVGEPHKYNEQTKGTI